jgi:nucleolar protein 56
MELNHCIGKFGLENNKITLLKENEEDVDAHMPAAAIDNNYRLLLQELRRPEYHEMLVKHNILLTKLMIANTVNRDNHVIQAINSIDDLDRICNMFAKRIREWYGYYFPEYAHDIDDNEMFLRKIVQHEKSELMKELSLKISMGPDIGKEDLDTIIGLARQAADLYSERDALKLYLDALMKEYCPNITAVAGSLIGAKLLEKAGSLRHLSMMPSSTIQLLGAEKALFRHLRNKNIRPPKHGLILSHPFVMEKKDKGKAARIFSSKISIASKVDYFKGEFIGDKLKEEMNK